MEMNELNNPAVEEVKEQVTQTPNTAKNSPAIVVEVKSPEKEVKPCGNKGGLTVAVMIALFGLACAFGFGSAIFKSAADLGIYKLGGLIVVVTAVIFNLIFFVSYVATRLVEGNKKASKLEWLILLVVYNVVFAILFIAVLTLRKNGAF